MSEMKQANKKSSLGKAAVGGGGIGTIIVGFAQLLPEGDPLRSFLVTVSPALTLGISGIWIWVGTQIENLNKSRKRSKVIEETRLYLNETIKDPNASDERKDLAHEQLIALDKKDFESRLQIVDNNVA